MLPTYSPADLPDVPFVLLFYFALAIGSSIAVAVMVIRALLDAARSMVLPKEDLITRDLSTADRRKRLRRQQRRNLERRRQA